MRVSLSTTIAMLVAVSAASSASITGCDQSKWGTCVMSVSSAFPCVYNEACACTSSMQYSSCYDAYCPGDLNANMASKSKFDSNISDLCRQAATLPPWVGTTAGAVPTNNVASTSKPFAPVKTVVGGNSPSPTGSAARIDVPFKGISCLIVALSLVL